MIFKDSHLPGEKSMACLRGMDRFRSIYAKDRWNFSFSLSPSLCLGWGPGSSPCTHLQVLLPSWPSPWSISHPGWLTVL